MAAGLVGADGGVVGDEGGGDDNDDDPEAAARASSSSSGGKVISPAAAATATDEGKPRGANSRRSGNGGNGWAEAGSSRDVENGGGRAEQEPAAGERRTAKRRKTEVQEQPGESKSAPANFSRVDPSLPRAELAERFPLFLEAESCTVEVKAGQMLYLPAGWFHEVREVVLSGVTRGLSLQAETNHLAVQSCDFGCF